MVRSMYVFAAAVALATAPFVYAGDVAADAARPAEETTTQAGNVTPSQDGVSTAGKAPALKLKALFATPAEEEVIDVIDGVAVGMGAMEVLVARVNSDGGVFMSCVDSEKAARAFLDAPIEKVAKKQAKEQ